MPKHIRTPHRKPLLAILLITILALNLMAGCATVGPDYVPPESEMPDAWHQELTSPDVVDHV